MRLPSPSGPHSVGLRTFSKHIPGRQVFGASQLADGDPALRMDEVAYHVYYPANVPTTTGSDWVYWLSRPLKDMTDGYAKFAGISSWLVWPIVYLIGRFVKMPVHSSAPLLSPPTSSASQWPLVIFSHGLAGNPTTYSNFCTVLASEGFVVLAIDHRDGSGPVVSVRCPDESKSSEGEKSRPSWYWRKMLYTRVDAVKWGAKGKPTASTMPFRVDQLKFRTAEVYEIYRSFVDLVSGKPGALRAEQDGVDRYNGEGMEIDPEEWKEKVKVTEGVVLAGHSFGGATALTILSSPPPPTHNALPLSHVLCLDPWVDPLPLAGPNPSSEPPSSSSSSVTNVELNKPPQLAVINSEKFTVWKDHFDHLVQITQDWKQSNNSTLITLIQSEHNDFSDFPLLLPRLLKVGKRAPQMAQLIQSLSLAFLRDGLKEELKKVPTREMEVINLPAPKEGKKGKTVLRGEFGEVVVHV